MGGPGGSSGLAAAGLLIPGGPTFRIGATIWKVCRLFHPPFSSLPPPMRARDKNLTVLSETEWLALYGLPNFDDFQRAEYFALTDDELALVYRRQSLPEQVLCLLQTGYFKAKQAFFH